MKIINKINYLLTKKDKINLVFMLFAALISAFLDLVGVSAILPIVSLLTQGKEAVDGNAFLRIINSIFNLNYELHSLTVISLGLLAFFFLFKAVYSVFFIYVINRFSLNYSRKLTKKLMEAYLMFPYEYHINTNSSTLIRKSTYDVTQFTSAINELLNFVVMFVSAISIVVYLFLTNWMIMLVVGGLLILFSLLILFIIKPKTKKYGKELQIHNSNNYKFLSQAFNGIKETKISNTEDFFVNEYDLNRWKINNVSLRRSVLNSLPGKLIEFVGMLGICISLIVIIAVSSNNVSAYIINTFSVFAYAVIKLLPSITTITTTINNIHFYETSINSLYDDIKLTENTNYIEKNTASALMPFNEKIDVKNVLFYYEGMPDKIVLNNVSVTINKNTSIAFSGASGSGKTTLIDIILGLLPCRNGKVLCDGIDIRENLRGWRTNISYIPQNIYLSDDTIRNNIAFGIENKNINDNLIWDALEKAQLKEFVKALPKQLDTVIGERGVRMSGGQRQRMGIARAFYRNTNIIVFDEATSALDYETEKNILEHVSKYSHNHTLIIITHRLNTIESCDHIYKVSDSKLQQIK